MLYPVELWDHAVARWQRITSAKMWRFGHTTKTGTKKGAASMQPLFSLGRAEHRSNHCPLELKPVALSPRFLFFLDFLSPASAAAPLEQHPAEEDLLQDAPLASVEAEAPLEQQPEDLDLSQEADLPSVEAEAPLEQQLADLDLSQEADLPSVEAEAPLEQQLADLDLSHDAFWSLEQVCSVLALLSAGASVDWADAVNAKNAKAPRKRNFFIVLLSFIDRRKHQIRCSVGKIQTPSVCDAGRERISLFLPSRNSQARESHADNSWRGGRVVMQQPAKL